MGKAGKSRRALERKKKRSGEKAAKKARYASYVGMAENVKSKRWQKKTKGGKGVNPFRQRVRSKRMAEWNGSWDAKLTWKQAHNTTSLKQYLKSL
jgi:hypothetical protein